MDREALAGSRGVPGNAAPTAGGESHPALKTSLVDRRAAQGLSGAAILAPAHGMTAARTRDAPFHKGHRGRSAIRICAAGAGTGAN